MDFKILPHHIKVVDGLSYAQPKWSRQAKKQYVLGSFLTIKKSENTYQRGTSTNRKTSPREKTTIIMLRNFGYTYNQLASAFERSTNYIYKIIKIAKKRGCLNTAALTDHRKGHISNRIRAAGNRLGTLLYIFSQWTAFIEGTEDKPP